MSCCGHGGSWFGNCGSAGSTTFGHTWSDGVQVCKEWGQSVVVIGQQLDAGQQQRNDSSNGPSNVKLKVDTKAAKLLAFTSVSMPGALLIMSSAHTPASTFTAHTTVKVPATSQGFGQLLPMTVHISVFLVTAVFCFVLINII